MLPTYEVLERWRISEVLDRYNLGWTWCDWHLRNHLLMLKGISA